MKNARSAQKATDWCLGVKCDDTVGAPECAAEGVAREESTYRSELEYTIKETKRGVRSKASGMQAGLSESSNTRAYWPFWASR